MRVHARARGRPATTRPRSAGGDLHARRLEPHRRGRLELGRAEAEVRGEPGRRLAQLGRRRLLVLEAPAPVLAPAARSLPSVSRVLRPRHPRPRTLAGRPGGGVLDATSRSSPRRSARPPPTGRSRRSPTAARPSHDGLAARLAGFERDRRRAAAWTCSRCAGRCGWSARTPRRRWRRCASCATARAAGSPGGAPPWVASWAGRWALGAGGAVEVGEDPTETLTRELAEEWSVEPERETGRGARLPAQPDGDADRPGLAAARRRGHARRRARRARLVAARRRRRGPARPTPRCGTWRGCSTRDHLHPPQVPLVRALGDLPHAARAGGS